MTSTSNLASLRDPGGESAIISNPGIGVRPLKIGLIGFGTVGRGFHDLVERRRASLSEDGAREPRISRVLVRDPAKDRGDAAARVAFTTDPARFLADPADVVVEATGAVEGVEPVVRRLLARGTPVVTANKALVAAHGPDLARIAARSGASFRFEASVAAGVPLFQLLERSLRTTRFVRAAAVLNGTSSFVLTRLSAPAGAPSFEAAIAEARRHGFAEPDSGDDVSGTDAARKLAILAMVLGSGGLPVGAIETTGIADVTPEDCARADAFGYRLQPVAVAELREPARAWVGPALVPKGHPLATVGNEWNGIHLSGDVVAEVFISGPGAGATPTAAALLDDVFCAAAEPSRELPFRRPPSSRDAARPRADAASDHWFLSFSITPGVIEPSDVVEFAAAAGLGFLELRRLASSRESLVIAGITVRAGRPRVDALRAALRRVTGVGPVRAFRVLEREGER